MLPLDDDTRHKGWTVALVLFGVIFILFLFGVDFKKLKLQLHNLYKRMRPVDPTLPPPPACPESASDDIMLTKFKPKSSSKPLANLVPISFTICQQQISNQETGPNLVLSFPGFIQCNSSLPLVSCPIFFEFILQLVPLHANVIIGLAPTNIPDVIPGRHPQSIGVESLYRRLFIAGAVACQSYMPPLLSGDRVGCICDQSSCSIWFLHNGKALPAVKLPNSFVDCRDLRPTFSSDNPCTLVANFSTLPR